MGRVSSMLLLLLCVIASAAATVRGDESLAHSIAPVYYDGAPSYSVSADTPFSLPSQSSSSWLEKMDQLPAPYSADTTVEEAFGPDAEKVYGQVSIVDGLSSKGDDGFSTLLKEGVTALLNSVDNHYKYTDADIKKCFSFKTALSSEAAATVQAHTFESANIEYENSHV